MFDQQSLKRISRVVQQVERQSFNGQPRLKNWPSAGLATSIEYAQAPAEGIPAIGGATPGEADCDVVVRATTAGTGYAAGDLVRTGEQVTVFNWSAKIAADKGRRLIQHVGGELVSYDCSDDDGDPASIKLATGA